MIPLASRLRSGVSWLFIMTIVLVVSAACGSQKNDVPLIFAAASLADVLTEAADAFENETGNRVEFNFGGSTALANQIARLDAPADGVILAGQGPIDLLVGREVLEGSNVVVVARNSLVVVSADDQVLNSLTELATSGGRVAIADPELAPAGQYAKEALISANIWDMLEEQIIPTLDVRAAVAAVSSRSVDFAIVYATDALSENDLSVVLEIDEALHSPVIYPAAPLPGDAASPTSAFLQFLLTPVGQEIFRNHGFSVN